ncbi:MAG: hypothetical protein KDD89_06950 [Anaerolineales bacterium]|nr:hypothetical protein [Anaerolineales bacterium]
MSDLIVSNHTTKTLEAELNTAVAELHEAERALAEEQAAVNAFRMHARLKLDDLVEKILDLRTTKQSLLTHLELQKQAQAMGIPYDEEDPFWHERQEEVEIPPEPADDLLVEMPRDRAAEKRLYRELARRFHPDLAEGAVQKAYSTSIMAAVNNAYQAGDTATLMDIAGDLAPEEMAELNQISNTAVRRLRRRLLTCRRRRRKVAYQLKTLREEKTAKLWRKAQALRESSTSAVEQNWWDEVRQDLVAMHGRVQKEVAQLRQELDQLEAQAPPVR